MKVQAVNLGFGKKPEKNANENNPNVFLRTTFGVAIGAISGSLARKHLPVSDEFFSEISKQNPEKKQSVQNIVNQFIKDYSSSSIQDARTLKTALTSADLKNILPELKNKGIEELINEPLIKNIDKNDSEELNNSLKVLQADILKDLASQDKNELLHKFENTSDMASNLLAQAKNGIIVKENLENYGQNIKGLAQNGEDNIPRIKYKISKEPSKPIQEQLSHAFAEMVQLAKISQRPFASWVFIPAAIVGVASLAQGINRKIALENKKGILA